MRRVIVFETTVETLVPKALIAMAVTRQLRDGDGDLSHRSISIACYAAELRRIECRTKTRPAWWHFKVCGNSRGIRGMLVL